MLVFAGSILILSSSACTPAATTTASPPVAATDHRAPASTIPEIPSQPTLVTAVPFYQKSNETEDEQTKVIIPAEVDGWRGNFIVDLGDPQLYLNRKFFQPNSTGGVDSVTAANRIPEQHGDKQEDTAHVSVLRIGTIAISVVEPTIPAPNPRNLNAFLNHAFGNYYNFAPRLGNIGLSALEPFETIIDYSHRRFILIRLDQAGRRLVDVPAYTPVWSAPLVDWTFPPASGARFVGERAWGVLASTPEVTDTMIFDTGAGVNVVSPTLAAHVVNGALPHVVIGGRTFTTVPTSTMDVGYNLNVLGYPFLSQLGIVGFNHRTHQFILYR